MTTLVAFTEATASIPGSNLSSATASLLISELIRNGPAWSLTCAITPSVATSVTRPMKWLRAELGHGHRRVVARQLDCKPGQRDTVDQPVPALSAHGIDAPGVGPTPNGIHAHAQELGGLTHLVCRHGPRP